MKATDRLVIRVYDAKGTEVGTADDTGVRDVAQAVQHAYDASNLPGAINDYSYFIDNLTEGYTEEYRVNAHGNVVLVPRESNR